MTKLTSFKNSIRPLFTERDIRAMSKAFNLASYDDVKARAAIIYDRIRGIGGAVMPPPPPEEKALGLNLASNCSLNGWTTGVRLRPYFLLQGSTTIFPPALFSSLARCASTIWSREKTLPTAPAVRRKRSVASNGRVACA